MLIPSDLPCVHALFVRLRVRQPTGLHVSPTACRVFPHHWLLLSHNDADADADASCQSGLLVMLFGQHAGGEGFRHVGMLDYRSGNGRLEGR
jgi:hypothetical protein